MTTALKDALMASFDEVGGAEYLLDLARTDPKTYCGLLAKLIPAELKLEGGGEDDVPLLVVKSYNGGKLVEDGAELLEKRVLDLMTSPVKTCTLDANIKEIMAVMTRSRIRHLPVVEDSRLVGIVSIGDVVKNRLEEVELEADVLRDAYIASH